MKFAFAIMAVFLVIACDNNRNLPDSVDQNVTPAPMEQREDEAINSPDIIDENTVPASEEEREREEENLYE